MAAHSKLLAFLRDCHEGDARESEEDFSGTPGVLDELSCLVEKEQLSPPLESLIQFDRVSTGEVSSWSGPLPVTLSPAQQKAVRAASIQPLSLLVGPPGTGKSYTLATVALEHVLRGESVLLCARSGQALHAIESQLRDLARITLPVVGGGDREEFLRFLTGLLDGDTSLERPGKSDGAEGFEELEELDEKIGALEKAAERGIDLETTWGNLVAGSRPSGPRRLLHALRRRFVDWQLTRGATLESVVSDYQNLVARRAAVAGRLVTGTFHGRLGRALEDAGG